MTLLCGLHVPAKQHLPPAASFLVCQYHTFHAIILERSLLHICGFTYPVILHESSLVTKITFQFRSPVEDVTLLSNFPVVAGTETLGYRYSSR